jgi:hypothetical protein
MLAMAARRVPRLSAATGLATLSTARQRRGNSGCCLPRPAVTQMSHPVWCGTALTPRLSRDSGQDSPCIADRRPPYRMLRERLLVLRSPHRTGRRQRLRTGHQSRHPRQPFGSRVRSRPIQAPGRRAVRQIASTCCWRTLIHRQLAPNPSFSRIPTARRPCQCRGCVGDLPQNGARQEHRRATTLYCASAGERTEV